MLTKIFYIIHQYQPWYRGVFTNLYVTKVCRENHISCTRLATQLQTCHIILELVTCIIDRRKNNSTTSAWVGIHRYSEYSGNDIHSPVLFVFHASHQRLYFSESGFDPRTCLHQIYCRTFGSRSYHDDHSRLQLRPTRAFSFGEPYINGIYIRLNCANHFPCVYSKMAFRSLYLNTSQTSFFNFPIIIPRFIKLAWGWDWVH